MKEVKVVKKYNFDKGKGRIGKGQSPLNPRELAVVSEYVKTGKKAASYKVAYNPKEASVAANRFFKRPRIVNALEKALKAKKFDDSYAVEQLKKIVDGGMANIDITRPDTALKALETYFKITNKIGGGNKVAIKLDIEAQAKKMDVNELTAALRNMDKQQKRILEVLKGGAPTLEEGEIVDD
jgi:phage terminase small subunit